MGDVLPDEESIYPPPVLCKDIMKLQLFMGCFARKKVRHDSTDNIKKITNANRIGAHRVNPVCTCAYELCAAYLSKYSRA